MLALLAVALGSNPDSIPGDLAPSLLGQCPAARLFSVPALLASPLGAVSVRSGRPLHLVVGCLFSLSALFSPQVCLFHPLCAQGGPSAHYCSV